MLYPYNIYVFKLMYNERSKSLSKVVRPNRLIIKTFQNEVSIPENDYITIALNVILTILYI